MSEINLSVKVVGGPEGIKGKTINLSVLKDMTVADMKVKVQGETEVEPDHQRLIYRGRVLKNDQTLESYGLEVR